MVWDLCKYFRLDQDLAKVLNRYGFREHFVLAAFDCFVNVLLFDVSSDTNYLRLQLFFDTIGFIETSDFFSGFITIHKGHA